MIKVTFEFKAIEEAVATLGTLLQRGAPVPTVNTPAQPAVEKKERKGRADAGKKRGPYKHVEQPGETTIAADPATADHAPVVSAPEAATPESATPENTDLSEKEIQAALDKLFEVKGVETAMKALAEFGVKRGRDLQPEDRAKFIERATELTNG